ncbi:hypothetical protein E4U19_000177 [Claviceps sp. Clav32 group G5]|nr:hypothetical protein E4U19_000177 [Claviceps sp. Clav32 group G5]
MTNRDGQQEPELEKKEGSWKAKTRLGGVKTAFASFRIEAQRRGRQRAPTHTRQGHVTPSGKWGPRRFGIDVLGSNFWTNVLFIEAATI